MHNLKQENRTLKEQINNGHGNEAESGANNNEIDEEKVCISYN